VSIPPSSLELFDALSILAASAIENSQLYRDLAHGAQYDSLTHLPNRLHLTRRLEESITRARSEGRQLALLYLDLDRFKQINDSLGHDAGDELLQQVSGRLSGCLAEGEIVARMGGDEFMVLLGEGDSDYTDRAANRLLDSLKRPLLVAGNDLFVSASIGISLYPGDGGDAVTLRKNADCAMYRAKERGKNRFEYFANGMTTLAIFRLEMESILRQALEQDRFEMHYQPQLTFQGELIGMEALIRLRHPKHGLLGPGEFIPIAEESGLILDIGAWALREVCRQRIEWERQGYNPPKIAINVSALQFARPDFAQTVAQTLRASGLPGSVLELELTESVVMMHMEESVREMEKLRALGCTIALDDFGTGYSSLSYLSRLPIDVLKIDISFVRDIDALSGTLPIVDSIVNLAHNLGLSSLAEGVERPSQYEHLKGIGCDSVQGFLLSGPLRAADMEVFLAAHSGVLHFAGS
jgi:diguanylate cyclase (GGDEF)-like protein